ncbi:MAG: hypothetical protein A3C50_02020 [Candidatus Staskawiczbacteria bacterium RIFCSPHIGHO2_02_FULL_43_16]|nr:MAG: hypothetical protein A3C50_02020 [Candidatus Staskawiczbacteria bacterium RIFCSPHIGHO2_02_FULL_43_16]
MSSTSTPLGPDFVKDLIPWMLQQFGEATAKAFRMIWDIGIGYLAQHWIAVLIGLFVIFVVALVRAFVTGRWAMLGSVVYNYLYFGTLFIIGSVFGPEVFANDYFKIVLAILYIACFILTGRFLTRIGVRRF